ncbi:MAG: 4-hydroxy-3-methylbut-2-enyl diphosphate reductase [Candidatus Omnitrophica bacterium]|nr:4-hydroxy-3-methylbut-2-enyl diphosphate reductase [Candidatus Omnitrophota bacterium]MBU1851325.1 4-hydroxy-3-methylbut-2-enyl diphosphate reductase [Candidatus Omnitrophota bacterium]
MKINVAKSSGFCFGVSRAIDICLSLADSKNPVHVLGDIVHNNHVVRELSEKGIRKVKSIRPAKKGSILIISAHGAPKETFTRARACGYRIMDATCPKVKDTYKIAKMLEKNNTVIIIGDKGHTEVKGIAGQLKKKPITIESPRGVPVSALKKIKKARVITQSTQSLSNINGIMDRLKRIIPDIKLYDTTCRITTVKQKEIESLTVENDCVLICGSVDSANTKRLYQIAKKMNRRTHWIESVKDIKLTWFKNAQKVGIMAGASTPDAIVEDIVSLLSSEKD